MPQRTALLSISILVAAPIFAQPPADLSRKFDEAERRIVRLPPGAFRKLPPALIRALDRRGCTIPQAEGTSDGQPNNVIHGAFARPNQDDWAILCSVKGTSSILVFWTGSDRNPASIAPFSDRTFIQSLTAERIDFSREIAAVGRQYILRHYRAYGGPKPPPIDHQGIDDRFVGKASNTLYFYRGRWLALQGAD
jgi:hypothetical protein